MEFWIQALLLSSSFVSVTLAGSVFDRQECAVPCGAGCGLFGDTCCTTPSGALNLCGYGKSANLHRYICFLTDLWVLRYLLL